VNAAVDFHLSSTTTNDPRLDDQFALGRAMQSNSPTLVYKLLNKVKHFNLGIPFVWACEKEIVRRLDLQTVKQMGVSGIKSMLAIRGISLAKITLGKVYY
jgi:hypothetical protein